MASNYDSIDLDWTWDGDYIIDEKGDLKDTSDDYLLSIRNEIQTVVKSALGDWRDEVEIGAGLDDFVGEGNTRETAELIKQRVMSALSSIVNPRDLSVRVTPVSIYKVLLMLRLEVIPTQENKLVAGTSVTISFLYDYQENGIYIPIDQELRFQGR